MSTKNKVLIGAIAGAVSLGLAASSTVQAATHKGMEKCYGVAKAGQNDCGGKGTGHACQGQSKKAGDPNEWLLVPKGLCDKLVNGSATPGADADQANGGDQNSANNNGDDQDSSDNNSDSSDN